MQWNIFRENIGQKSIEVRNIFDHLGFHRDVLNDLQDCESKEEFAKKLKSNLMYYFWCKSEHEVLITPWINSERAERAKKVDVYWQVMNNWEVFLDYVWSHKN